MRRDGIQAAVAAAGHACAARGARVVARRGGRRRLGALWVSRAARVGGGRGAPRRCGASARARRCSTPARSRARSAPVGNALVAPLARWDSVWYLAIANDGYPADDARRAAFFPLYPLLVRAADTVVGSPIVAGALVSLACFAVALVAAAPAHRARARRAGRAR